jgi:deoxyadenosine/deoxycytidine kinase
MYLLISGPSCSGKTSLAASLLEQTADSAYFEPTSTSRYYPMFLEDMPRFALKNQVDFMRISFHQEQKITTSNAPLLVQDAGLLVCHHVYSAYFRDKGYLTESEYEGLERNYLKKIRRCRLPDAVIHLTAKIEVLETRALRRDERLIHNFVEILPYWDRLAKLFLEMNIPVLLLDTSHTGLDEIKNRAVEWLSQLHSTGSAVS